jgi:tRNA dimethylallyltransferase
MPKADLITITGPTASGKTRFAAVLAAKFDGEIISADSRQVYRQMNIGTGKDYDDYCVDGSIIANHLIDIRDAGEKYNLFEFQQDFLSCYDALRKKGKLPFLVGGTGMYIESVLKGYNLQAVPENKQLREELSKHDLDELVQMLRATKPNLHNTTDTTSKKRVIRSLEIAQHSKNHSGSHGFPTFNSVILGMAFDRECRRRRISERLSTRLEEGMISEVEALLKKVKAEDLIFYGLEYKYITLYLIGELSRQQMVEKLEIAIHQFAKRQMTWFRKMERQGMPIHWIDGQLPMEEKIAQAGRIFGSYGIETDF